MQMTKTCICNVGAQMDILPVKILSQLGISTTNIFPVQARVGGPSAEPITIIGGYPFQSTQNFVNSSTVI